MRLRPLTALRLGGVAAALLVFVALVTLAHPAPPAAARASSSSIAPPDAVRAAPRALPSLPPPRAPLAALPRFLKGQAHAHTTHSRDARTPPDALLRWYAARGYDFVVLTDHNRVTRVDPAAPQGGMLVIPGVELTRNVRDCTAPAARLHGGCLIHLNALFVQDPGTDRVALPPVAGRDLLSLYEGPLSVARGLGALAQINHPRFNHTVDAPTLTALAARGAALFEIANRTVDGDDTTGAAARATEAMWDAALSAGQTLYAVAVDDAHDLTGAPRSPRARRAGAVGDATVGDYGFVMVRAAREPAAVREALAAGRFYSSTGVLLDLADEVAGALCVRLSPAARGPHTVTFVGQGGAVLSEVAAREACFELARVPPGGYVRAVVRAADGRRAWVQPLRRARTTS